MRVQHHTDVESKTVEMPGAAGCRVRWLVSADDGAPNFAMREFEIEPGGYTPRHHHPYEHEVYVLEGQGEVYENDQAHPIKSGDVILVAPDDIHQFRNTGPVPLKFLCLIPNSAAGQPIHLAPECGTDETTAGGC